MVGCNFKSGAVQHALVGGGEDSSSRNMTGLYCLQMGMVLLNVDLCDWLALKTRLTLYAAMFAKAVSVSMSGSLPAIA